MSDRITTAEALRLAREALEDDKRATSGPWTTDETPRFAGAVSAIVDGLPRQVALATGQAAMFDRRLETHEVVVANAGIIAASRTREPALARAVVEMLTATDDDVLDGFTAEEEAARYALAGASPSWMRALAAALWRAADESEGGR